MVAIGSIPLHYDKKTRRFHPIFLSEKDTATIEKAITIFQSNEGTRRSEYINERFLQNFADFRMASVMHDVFMKQFYGFLPISKGFSSKKRMKVWKILATTMPQGFASSDEHRQAILADLAKAYSIETPEVLERRLFYDHQDSLQLTKIRRPSIQAVKDEYNWQILAVLIQNANWVRFKIDPKADLKGTPFKKLLFLAKRNGVYIDISLETEWRVIELLGPRRLVKRSRYSRSLGKVLKSATNFALSGEQGLIPIIEIALPRGRGERIIEVTPEAFERIYGEIEEKDVLFDSEVEKRLYYQLSNDPWVVEREPLLHFDKENLLFLPDFRLSLRFNQVNVYLEVVGFWTKEYLEKKVEKLNRLPSDFQDLILVVDSSLAFPETRFPTFYYKNLKNLPVGEVLGFLDRKFVQPHSDALLKELLTKTAEFVERINSTLKDSQILEMEKIAGIFQCNESRINFQVIEEIVAQEKPRNWEFLPSFGIFHKELIITVKKTMSQLFTASQRPKAWSEVENALKPIIPLEAMEPALKACGFEVLWKGLTQKTVRSGRGA
ncbi:MAG: DUF790 family protein [Candidatus Hodarchaeales archaeon]|jgi:predicted nuclease of restriction endonuclease-like RecB superfamily